MNVGDYVKTKYGKIAKIVKIEFDDECQKDICIFDKEIIPYYECEVDNCYKEELNKYIIKSSPNIIDLIEEGDYVNGIRVDEIKNGQLRTSSYYDGYICHLCNDNEIKSIVTKEQFETMKYKVKE